MSVVSILLLIAGCVVVSAAATGLVLFWLRHRRIVDHPNERSSHDRPTPRGGGLAVMAVITVAWAGLTIGGAAPWTTIPILVLGLALAVVSWRDDLASLPVGVRLAAQAVAIAAGLFFLPGIGGVFQGMLPPWLDILATGLLWAWFVNLFNFMDGIDGITGAEAVALGLGIALVAVIVADPNDGRAPLGVALAAAALGFLVWNWHPAKLFLGDVGSVPLGFLIGWLLLGLAGRGYWAAALILPLYYLADASLTLVRRLLTGERVWRPHRQHFYQRAVQRGLSHGAVTGLIILANLGLIVLAAAAVWWHALEWPAIGLAVILVGLLLHRLSQGARRGLGPDVEPPIADGSA
ncbi:MAG TPA: glycosyltransferase family 4 protein [Stellaceae bacterium]|nr:glycosyltransferase family 4 protein [Stellaceae bacterium]